MKAIGVLGGDGTLADRLVDRLGERGAVARIQRDRDVARAGGGSTFRVDDEGNWSGDGSAATPAALLDRVAPTHEYAVVEDCPELPIGQVAIGSVDPPSDATVVLEAEEPAAVDLGELVEDVESLEPHETLSSLVARAKQSPGADRAGAIATFTGRVRRRDDPEDVPTEFLEFEKYEGVAAERMAAIREELEARDGVFEVLLHHRTGRVDAGEDIVFVVVLAGHRREAFRTVEDGIDRLKDEVPLFKREVTVEEEFWVHERE